MLAPLASNAAAFVSGLVAAESAEVFFEVETAAGVPDMVVTAFDVDVVARRDAECLGPVVDLMQVRVLMALRDGVSDLDGLAMAAGVSRAHLRRTVVPALARAGWCELLGSRDAVLVARATFEPVTLWNVTIEAKRSDWARAVAQAGRHTRAADRAFVALDLSRARPAVRAGREIAALGIGVATVRAGVDDGEAVVVDVAPDVRRRGMPRGHRRHNVVEHALLGERLWAMRRAGVSVGPTALVFGLDLALG